MCGGGCVRRLCAEVVSEVVWQELRDVGILHNSVLMKRFIPYQMSQFVVFVPQKRFNQDKTALFPMIQEMTFEHQFVAKIM